MATAYPDLKRALMAAAMALASSGAGAAEPGRDYCLGRDVGFDIAATFEQTPPLGMTGLKVAAVEGVATAADTPTLHACTALVRFSNGESHRVAFYVERMPGAGFYAHLKFLDRDN